MMVIPAYTIPETDKDLWKCGQRLTGQGESEAPAKPVRKLRPLQPIPPWGALPQRIRKALTLFAEGQNYREVASGIGRTPAGVKQFGKGPVTKENVRQLLAKALRPVVKHVPEDVCRGDYFTRENMQKIAAWWLRFDSGPLLQSDLGDRPCAPMFKPITPPAVIGTKPMDLAPPQVAQKAHFSPKGRGFRHMSCPRCKEHGKLTPEERTLGFVCGECVKQIRAIESVNKMLKIKGNMILHDNSGYGEPLTLDEVLEKMFPGQVIR